MLSRNFNQSVRCLHTGVVAFQYIQQSRSSIPIDTWLKNSNKRLDDRQNQKRLNRNQRENRSHQKSRTPRIVTWSTGSERAKEAANSVLRKIFEVNPKGNIRYLNDEGKVEETNIRSFAKGMNLDNQGLNIVSIIKNEKEREPLPFVKIVDSATALRKYSDYLAEKKVDELKAMGLMPKKLIAKDKNSSDDNLKHIKISWNIKEDDLAKQKAHDITTMLKKGNKVNLYLADRDDISAKNWMENFENMNSNGFVKKIKNNEVAMRESVIAKLKEISEEYAIEPAIEGSVLSKMVIKLTPKPSAVSKDIKALKEEKKRRRLEKMQKRLQKLHEKNNDE